MNRILSFFNVMIKELFRKKDFYVLLIFIITLLLILSMQTFFNVGGISRYLTDLGYSMLMFFSLIICISITARQIPSEISSGSIYALLAKPVSRYDVVIGKYAGSVLVSVISYTIFFIVFSSFYMFSGSEHNVILLSQCFLTGALLLAFVSSMVMFFPIL